jgi:hypothetical protein
VVLPGGDLVVAYETAREDIYFKRGPFERLATAAERPVAISQREMEKFPFVVRSGTRLVFFWMSADRHDPRPLWRVRVRTYTPAWTEAEASWGPAHDLSQTGTFLEEGPGPDPDAPPTNSGSWSTCTWSVTIPSPAGASLSGSSPRRSAASGRSLCSPPAGGEDLAVLERCQSRRQPG